MATYTAVDIEHASKFADYNVTVRLLERMYKKSPHLTSWLNVTVRDATDADFYVPAALQHVARVIDVQLTETACKMLSCNPMKERTNCQPNEAASYYRVGDDGFDVQCQPACFHTAVKQSYDKDGKRASDTPMLNWNAGKCHIVNGPMVAWLEKPFYRSETKYELRVNDMPTRFSRIEDRDNPYGSGITYRTNNAYCQYYDRIREENGSCEMSLWEKIVDPLLGMSLVNAVRSSVRMFTNGNKPFDEPTDLPDYPKELPPMYTYNGWKANVNADFKLPSTVDPTPIHPDVNVRRSRRQTKTKEDERRDHEAETFRDPNNASDMMRNAIYVGRHPSEASTRVIEPPDKEDDQLPVWRDKLKRVFVGMLHALTTQEFWTQFAIDTAVSSVLDRLKGLCAKLVEKMAALLTKDAVRTLGAVGIRVLSAAIESTALRVAIGAALRIGARLTIMLAKLVGAAASVVGWILVIGALIDLMFGIWDPYGYKNLFPPDYPRTIMSNAELSLRQSMASATATYEFTNLVSLTLTEDEIMEVQLESLLDRVIYLDALVVNSEGTRLDKGQEVNLNTVPDSEFESAKNATIAERTRFTVDAFLEDTRRFDTRVRMNRFLNYVASGLAAIGCFFLLTRFTIVFAFFAFLALLVFCLAQISLQQDFLLDAFERINLSI